jgi:hypothetical protein
LYRTDDKYTASIAPNPKKKRAIHQILVFHITNIMSVTKQVVITITATTAIPAFREFHHSNYTSGRDQYGIQILVLP